MTDMVEKVARAICFRDNDRDQAKADENWNYDAGELYLDFARAAVEAMREPTEEMIDAAYVPGDSVGMGLVDARMARETWHTMIGAALSTKEE